MKKLSLILLATFYFACASGVYVHAHFCGGELSSVSYFAFNDSKDCGCGDEAADSECCKDILHFYKVDLHQDASFVKASDVFALKLPILFTYLKKFKSIVFVSNAPLHNTHAPPPFLFAKASKLIVNSVFRL